MLKTFLFICSVLIVAGLVLVGNVLNAHSWVFWIPAIVLSIVQIIVFWAQPTRCTELVSRLFDLAYYILIVGLIGGAGKVITDFDDYWNEAQLKSYNYAIQHIDIEISALERLKSDLSKITQRLNDPPPVPDHCNVPFDFVDGGRDRITVPSLEYEHSPRHAFEDMEPGCPNIAADLMVKTRIANDIDKKENEIKRLEQVISQGPTGAASKLATADEHKRNEDRRDWWLKFWFPLLILCAVAGKIGQTTFVLLNFGEKTRDTVA